MNLFKDIKLSGWRQFERVEIDFTQPFTILTGQNGTGKTTVLNILARHFGRDVHFVTAPYSLRKRAVKIWTDIWALVSKFQDNREPDGPEIASTADVGSIGYTEAQNRCQLRVPSMHSAHYSLSLLQQAPVDGLAIPSHLPPMSYQTISAIPTQPQAASQAFSSYQGLLWQLHGEGSTQNPSRAMKQSLIALAVIGIGNEVAQPNDEYRELFLSFQEVLKRVLPPALQFEKLEVRVPEIVLVTKSGTFPLDAMSGGVAMVFSLAWQIHMFGWRKSGYTVVIDEPENHLHPSMQRILLPSLSAAFPNCMFIVATHSPLIVSSHRHAAVYGLMFNSQRRVESFAIDTAELAGNANKILRDILDVPASIPIWAEESIESALRELEADPNNAELVPSFLSPRIYR